MKLCVGTHGCANGQNRDLRLRLQELSRTLDLRCLML